MIKYDRYVRKNLSLVGISVQTTASEGRHKVSVWTPISICKESNFLLHSLVGIWSPFCRNLFIQLWNNNTCHVTDVSKWHIMNRQWAEFSEAITDFAWTTKVSLKGQFFRTIWPLPAEYQHHDLSAQTVELKGETCTIIRVHWTLAPQHAT